MNLEFQIHELGSTLFARHKNSINICSNEKSHWQEVLQLGKLAGTQPEPPKGGLKYNKKLLGSKRPIPKSLIE